MDRRIFLKSACLTCASLTVGSTLFQSCSSVHAVVGTLDNNRILLKKSDFIFFKKEKEMVRQWVLVKTDRIPFPIGVYRFEAEKYAATYLECSHQGCEVETEGDHLQCPCHGSEFTNTGKLLKGPAEADLKSFKVETDQNNIYIILK
jgi:Rieske Fe-S protein